MDHRPRVRRRPHRWPLHTSLLEGVNNKIEVLKHPAYGFRDDDHFLLKLRQGFPGIP